MVKICPENRQDFQDRLDTLELRKGNKWHEEIIGNAMVKYIFYLNGTIMVSVASSNNPFRLENDSDLSDLMAFFGQIRDRLVLLLKDHHERIVPPIMDWYLTQCDINKDIHVNDWFQVTGIKLQWRQYDRLFRLYIKAMEKKYCQ